MKVDALMELFFRDPAFFDIPVKPSCPIAGLGKVRKIP